MTLDEARWSRNEALLKARVEHELLAGRAFVEDRIGQLFTGVLGRVMNPVARSLYHAIGEEGVRRRVHAHTDVVVSAARDTQTGSREAALAEWTPRALASEELVHRGNRRHPRYPEAVSMLEDAFAERVDALRTFLADGDGDAYEDVVRTAFPDRAELDALFARHFARGRAIVALVEASPDLLRFPKALQGPLFRLVKDVMTEYETRLNEDLARIYDGG